MPEQSEHQPFLEKYSDDAALSPHRATAPPPRRSTATKFLPHMITFVATSILWSLTILLLVPKPSHHAHAAGSAPHNVTSGARLLTCGNSVAEARAHDCTYDILLNNWVPQPCFDKNSLEVYKEDMSWAGFADVNMTQKLTMEQMSEADMYYTSVRDHVNHCAIMWRRQFDMLFYEADAFDTVVASPGHTDHCSQYLMDVGDNNWDQATQTYAGFAGCWVRE